MVTGYSETSCLKGPLLVSTSSTWLHGSKSSQAPYDRRTFCAQDPGFEHGAPTAHGAEEDNGLYSKEHGNEARELHRSKGTLLSAWRDEDDPKLRELMRDAGVGVGITHPHSAERFT